MSESDVPIARVLEAYQSAVLAKDIDAFMALYDRDVRIFDAWGRWSYDGVEEWRGMVNGWFGSLGSERVVVDFSNVQISGVSGFAVAHAFVRYKGVSSQGVDLRAMDNRLTWILRDRDGTWKIVHEHTSAPLDFESTKALLVR